MVAESGSATQNEKDNVCAAPYCEAAGYYIFVLFCAEENQKVKLKRQLARDLGKVHVVLKTFAAVSYAT